jgi:hypothetical protein
MIGMEVASAASGEIEASATTDASRPPVLHIICDRDIGLFALILSVIPHIEWVLREGRIPVVCYESGNCYWTPRGYRNCDTVWEYYFEPVVPQYSASSIPSHIRELIRTEPPVPSEMGRFVDEHAFVSSHLTGRNPFGRNGKRIKTFIGPGRTRRAKASSIIRDYIRPRAYIAEKADRFFREHLAGQYVIGVHIRGTDALVDPGRTLKESCVNFSKYFAIVERLLFAHPDAKILVASDAQSSVNRMRERFGGRIVAYDSLRHQEGELAGRGPRGAIMPAYLTRDRDLAARSGEEAVVEYLLLCRCNHLVHNSSNLSWAVLMTVPDMPASNVIAKLAYLRRASGAVWLNRVGSIWRHRAKLVRDTILGKPIGSWPRLLHELWITKRAARLQALRRP